MGLFGQFETIEFMKERALMVLSLNKTSNMKFHYRKNKYSNTEAIIESTYSVHEGKMIFECNTHQLGLIL